MPSRPTAAPLRVAIVGGGVAGAATACGLARLTRGASDARPMFEVTLFEPRRGEGGGAARAKCCGHCLHPRARRAVEQLGLLAVVEGAASARTEHARIERVGERPFVARLDTPGWVVRRDRLDPALREEAARCGASIVGARAHLRRDDSGWFASTQDGRHDAAELDRPFDLVVGADGLSSPTARSAGLVSRTEQGRRFGLSFDLAPCATTDELVAPQMVRMIVGDGCYLGLVRDDHGVHAGVLLDAGRSVRDALRAMAARDASLGVLDGALLDDALRNAAAAGPIPFTPTAAVAERLALVGDAAGYVEPFTGEGMAWAFESAAILTESAQHAAQFDASSAERVASILRRYQASRARRLAATQARCRKIAWVVARPRLVSLALRGAHLVPKLASRVASRIASGGGSRGEP